jgi:hypothetical protein
MFVGDPPGLALMIALAIGIAVVLIAVWVGVGRRRERVQFEKVHGKDRPPWWRGPNAPKDPPAPNRHREWE